MESGELPLKQRIAAAMVEADRENRAPPSGLRGVRQAVDARLPRDAVGHYTGQRLNQADGAHVTPARVPPPTTSSAESRHGSQH